MARYLVTGVAGFIGSWIAQRLVCQGHQVRGLDNMSSGKSANLLAIAGAIEFRQVDIRNPEDVDGACKNVDGIFHQAAVASVQDSIDRPFETNDINYGGTLNVIRGAKAHGVRRIVFASSSAIYGSKRAAKCDEGMNAEPVSPYGVQKLSCEHALRVAQVLDKIETVSLRYFNVFGPRQSASSPYSGVIAKFAQYVSSSKCEQPVVYGDGEQSRDFVYIEDVVAANLLAMSAPGERVTGKAFNIGSGQSLTINALIDHLRVITGEPLHLRHVPARSGEIRASSADISAACDALEYYPRWKFRDGLARTVNWYREPRPDQRMKAGKNAVVIPEPPARRKVGLV